MKKCATCKEIKDLTLFCKDKRESDGRAYTCRDCKNSFQREFNQTPKGRYLSYKKRARERAYSFPLSIEQFLSFWGTNCFYCGEKVEGIGLDRVVNSIGYELENIVQCCYRCNLMKHSNTKDSFISQCKKIAAKHS